MININIINTLVLLNYLLIKVYCCPASNCQSCPLVYCDECIPGYYVYLTFCYQCSINNCNTCSSEYICTSCKDGFYLNSNSECLPCSLPCSTCIQSNSNCLTCYESQNQQSPQCNCISQKYMNDQYQCKNCLIPCLTCSSQFTCLTCVDSYYLSGTSCLQCTQPCQKCNISSTNCITCIGPFRSPPDCNCNQGYLLNVSNQCQKCTFPCLTCQNTFTECLSCYNSYNHNQLTNQCKCLENQAEIMSTPNYCVDCQLPCLTCENSATECLTCITGTTLSDTKCICSNDYYFDNESNSCQKCQLPCIKCITKSQCSECFQTQQLLDDCHCPIGEYLTLTSECQKCGTNCLECVDSITCKQCSFGYYLSNLKECIQCQLPCVTCSNESYQCLSCILNSSLTNGNDCICDDGYYMNSLKECQSCKKPCQTCIDSNKCLKCIENFILSVSKTCVCQDGMFFDVLYSKCSQCEQPCSNCVDQKNICLSCIDENQTIINQTCQCKQGWLINHENMCDQCKQPCFACQETLTKCLSCKDSNHTLIDGECVCPENFGDDVNYNCILCESPCKKCQFISSFCLTCISEQYILTSENQCKCKTGFMMNINKQCDACHISCKECEINVSNCIVCKDLNHLIINGNCECKSGFISDLKFNCVPCQSPCQTCQIDTTLCLTCISNDFYVNEQSKCICVDSLKYNLSDKCECISGYYKKNEICHQCLYPCSECFNQDVCISCYNIDKVILKNNKCVCDSGYFLQKDFCNKCDQLCFTCLDDKYNCKSCYQSQLRVLNNNKCVCQNGYFENSQNLCESCISDTGKIQDTCSVLDCNDKQWMYGEQCDDGNDVPRDGCTNCVINKFYSCYNQIFQKSQCYQCLPYCKQCQILESIQIVCIECEQDYFIDHQSCSKCSDKCLGCKSKSNDCISCRFIKNSQGECQLCESEVGSYSNFELNSCYTKCGDGIKSKNEECDDGNIIDGDGCNSICQQEKKFLCKESTCITPSYPKPSLKIIGDTSEYQQLRQFELTYDQELSINENFKLQDYFNLFLIFDNKERIIDYEFNLTQNLIYNENQKQYGNVILKINLLISNDSSDEQFLIKFHNQTEIKSYQGYSQQETQIKCQINSVIFIQQDTVKQVQKITKTNQYIIYIISAMSIGSILLGGIEIFYNLLDLLQLLSYLKYINTNLPYNLQEFFKLFELFQFNFFTEYLKYYYQIGKIIDFSLIQRPSLQLSNENITSLFIINAFPIFLVFLSSFCIYGLAFVFSKILNLINLKNDQIIKTTNIFLIKAALLFYNLRIFVNQFYYQIKIKLFYSGIQRIYISIAYDFAFSIILQLNNLQFYSDLYLVPLSSFLATLSLIVYQANIYFIIKVSGMSNYAIQSYQNQLKYGSIFEGVNKKRKNCRYFTSIQLTKKFISMIFLILAYQFPVFQILNLIFLSVLMSIYMIIFKPLIEKSEFIKQFLCDISITCTQINILILVCDSQVKYFSYQIREDIGWSCIFFMSSIIIIQIFVDLKQQWTFLFKNFKTFRKLLLKIYNLFQKENKQTSPKVFLSK